MKKTLLLPLFVVVCLVGDTSVRAIATTAQQLQAPSTINGNVFLAPGATFTKKGTVNGAVFTNQSQLAQ